MTRIGNGSCKINLVVHAPLTVSVGLAFRLFQTGKPDFDKESSPENTGSVEKAQLQGPVHFHSKVCTV